MTNKNEKIVSYIIGFLFIFIGIILMSIAFLTPGPNILESVLGGGSAGLGAVMIKNIRRNKNGN